MGESMRYDQLIALAAQKKPDVLIEIGTHRGARARLLKAHCKKYYGFDLWESGSDETDRRESNGKGRSTKAQAAQALAGAAFELIAGDTRETLPQFVKRGIKVDFAWIDGGHSIQTIASDWEWISQMLEPGAVVVFDDYYTPRRTGFGCNVIVGGIEHELLNGDTFDGTLIRLVKYVHPSGAA
ncbi:MAG: class I SAM-dependent methyltransferase [Sulfuricaulis sp.]|nr:class I SAM-dependent methyltransferase [Sulfuricaulis sp.]